MPDEQAVPASKRPWWKKKRWYVLLALLALGVWLNGPGWRFIARQAGRHYLEKAGLQGDFEPKGNLSDGKIGVKNVEIEGEGPIKNLTIDNLEIGYSAKESFKPAIRSLKLDGAHLDFDLSAESENQPKEEKPPGPDLPTRLADLRRQAIPLQLDFTDVSVNVTNGDDLVVALDSTDLTHAAGSETFELDLGTLDFPEDRRLAAQDVEIRWEEERLTLPALDVMPELGLRDVAMTYAGPRPDFDGTLLLQGARFEIESDLSTATIEKNDRPLEVADTLALFQLDLPLQANVTEFRADLANLRDGLQAITGTVEIAATEVAYQDWTAAHLGLAARLDPASLAAALRGLALGSPLEIDATLAFQDEASFALRSIDYDLRSSAAAPALENVRRRYVDPLPEPGLPPATLAASGNLAFDAEAGLTGITTDLALRSPETDAPPLDLDASWSPGGALTATLTAPGLEAEGGYDFPARSYDGEAALEDLLLGSLSPWLAPFGVALPENLRLTAVWSGGGDLAAATHRGELDLPSLVWNRPAQDGPLEASARATYDWPRTLSVPALRVTQDGQTIEAALNLADDRLTLDRLAWLADETVLFRGSGSFPVPAGPTDWRAILRSEEPARLDLASKTLPLTRLHPFLPETVRFTENATAQLDVQLTGTPAAPELDATLTASRLGLTGRDAVPPIDATFTAIGKGNDLKLDGTLQAPDFPPAEITAVTRWSPRLWAEDPETFRNAPLDASLRLANLNLAPFQRFVPNARRLEGQLDLNVTVDGTVTEPKPLGTLTLQNGRFETPDPTIPRFQDASLRATATLDQIQLERLQTEISGGSLRGSGTLALGENGLSQVDLSLTGRSLPVVRNDTMIIRADADLSLAGPWETARLSGAVRIVDSLFFKDIEILPIGVPFDRPATPELPSIDAPPAEAVTSKIPEPFNDWSVAVRVTTGNPFLIRGNLARGNVTLDANLGGTFGNPRPTGTAFLNEVSAELPFSTLTVRQGFVRLRPDQPFDPVLDIRAESIVRPYDIRIYAYGPLSDPTLLPTSTPPLPQEEIMTLLATGTTTRGLEDPQAATARAAQLLIEEIRRGRVGFLSDFRPLLAVLDDVDFQLGAENPYTSERFNSATLQLADKWLLRAGVSDVGNTRASLVYLLRFR